MCYKEIRSPPLKAYDASYEIGRIPRLWVGDNDDDDNSRASQEYLVNILLSLSIPCPSSDVEIKESLSLFSETIKHNFFSAPT
jgi:hypothetical protein